MTETPTSNAPLHWVQISNHAKALEDDDGNRLAVVVNHRWTVAGIWKVPFRRQEFTSHETALGTVERWAASYGHPIPEID